MRVKVDTRDLRKIQRAGYDRQLPFALSRTLNRLAYLAQQEVRQKADKHIDRGANPWTKSGIRFRKSSKRRLVADVYVADGREYIKTIVEGGDVLPEKRVLVQPAQVRLNRYGNITRGKVRKMTANKQKYFVGVPKGIPERQENEGVWQRMGRGGRKKIRQVVKFKDRRYQRAIFPADRLAMRKAERRLGVTLTRELRNAMASAR